MRHKIFKNILIGNFKSNKNLPLSFMVFLVLGFALIFGMFSFLFNLGQAIPTEAKSHNKNLYHVWFDMMRIDENDWKDSTYSEEDNDRIFKYYLAEFQKSQPNTPIDQVWVKKFVQELNNSADGYYNRLSNGIKEGHEDSIDMFGDYMYNTKGIGNFSLMYLNDLFFNQPDFLKRKINIQETYAYRQYPPDRNEEMIYFLTPQAYNQDAYKKAGKDKGNLAPDYRDEEGNLVIYANRTTAKRYHYKVGQKIELPLIPPTPLPNGFSKKNITYVYGGSMDYSFHMDLGINDKNPIDYYFTPGILNDQGVNQAWKFVRDKNAVLSFYNPKTNDMEAYAHDYLRTILTTSNLDDFGWLNKDYVAIGELFSSMRMLTLILLAILIILAFSLTYYLIREIINANFNELLTLKTLGMNNVTLSGINMAEIIFLTLLPLLGAIPLSMLIQEIFIRMIDTFINLHFTMYDFNLLLIPLVIGIVVVLSIGYFLCSALLFKRIDLTNGINSVRRVDPFQKIFSKYYFRINTNFGINHAFLTKNLSKIITTLFLEVAIFLFISVVLQFSWSISTGQNAYLKNYGHFDYSSSPTYNLKNVSLQQNPDGSYRNYINYSMALKDPQREITFDNLEKLGESNLNLTGYYIKRTTIEEMIAAYPNLPFRDENIDLMIEKYNQFIGQYDDLVSKYLEITHNNFEFDFGVTLHDSNQRVSAATSLALWNSEDYRPINVFVIDQNNVMYNQVFNKKDQLKMKVSGYNNSLHLVISQNTLDRRQLDLQNASNQLRIDDNIILDNLYMGESFVKTAVIHDTGFLDKNNLINVLKHQPSNPTNEAILYNLEHNLQNDLVFSERIPYSFNNIPIRDTKLDSTWQSYAQGFQDLDEYHHLENLTVLKRQIEYVADRVQPISNSMNILLLIAVFIYFLIIIFIVSLIGDENKEIIFIMKAMGYSQGRILAQITSGYSLAIIIGMVLAEVVAIYLIQMLNSSFESLIEMTIAYSYNYAIIVLLIVLVCFSWFVIYYIIAGEIENCDTAHRAD